MKSYWEKTSELPVLKPVARSVFDVCVLGGGIIGSNIAIELAERMPGANIALVEREGGPRGASTRNAGFACFGSVSEIAHDIDLLSAESAYALVERRYRGLQMLRQRCGDNNIRYEQLGGHEIFLEHHASLDRIDEINDLLHPIFKANAFEIRNDLITEHGFSSKIQTLVRTPFEGMLHSGMLIRCLWEMARDKKVNIIVADGVPQFTRNDTQFVVSLGDGSTIFCNRVVVATNSLIEDVISPVALLPSRHVALHPARGQVIVTEPIPGLQLSGTYHFNEGYVYFRNVDGRVLLGGGRDIAFEEEETNSMELTETIQNYLEQFLNNVIMNGRYIEIEHRWAGTMAFSNTKKPIVKEIEPGVFVAFGCNGMGVAIATDVASQCASLLVW